MGWIQAAAGRTTTVRTETAVASVREAMEEAAEVEAETEMNGMTGEQIRQGIIGQAERLVQEQLGGDSSGHDWWHMFRVARTARRIAEAEGADVFVCELAALLHDLADEKLVEDKEAGQRRIEAWLNEAGVSPGDTDHIMEIIRTVSYSGGHGVPMRTLEGRIVQDADRLDAIGAIGIGRTFAYGGAKGRLMHDPAQAPREAMTQEEYRSSGGTAINHFYEKLLKLKDLMNTDTGRALALERHRYMEGFLEQFYQEWEGESPMFRKTP
ncbi:HD domain-containing protein [Paenibacillus mucilaginosus 3016]|uniref:HD domain-containing protein n=2 Tax=Paenibacillus mucilaginosus TaxID=61624 RepID=H6NRA2_9BACL|nr:HD domain-containing protein [Paenibacillus mucilaginosus 3016]